MEVPENTNTEILKEVQGLDFYKVFFDQKIYEDGRELSEDRPCVIKAGLDRNAAGSSFVQYQGCVVSCKVTAKAGYYDPKQCVRFRFERANCIPKREFDFVRAVLDDFSRKHVFVDPQSLVFDTEYQVQLFVTLTINTCDGFLLGAVLAAINAALSNTQLPTMSADLDENDDEMDDDATYKRLMRRKSKFRADTEKMLKLQVASQPHYSGFLVYNAETDDPTFLYDPPDQIIQLIRRRIDIVLGSEDQIFFWQCATFQNGLTKEFRQKIVDMAKGRRDAEMMRLQEGVARANADF
ncbi:hypothetical protein M3Y97_00140100 [Aphelenchoides bicaudatus]|nr:hypothetical protein M3Y97_00140100 [Aphelenchoides bicaudatus]